MTNTLNSIERIALVGLMARKREALAPILGDEQAVVRLIEERLDLPSGAIGTTHQVSMDGDGMRVVAVTAPSDIPDGDGPVVLGDENMEVG